MRPAPSQQLDPRIKNVWRISALITTVIVYACCALPFLLVGLFSAEEAGWAYMLVAAETALAVIALVVFVVVLPPLRYIRWHYQLDPGFLDISKGIVWRQRCVIPFIRVQNTDTQQGPIMRAFHLSSVTVSTAAGNHQIPGIDIEQADALRDKAAEFARIAREDV